MDDEAEYEIHVDKEDFKFNCAHFIAHRGFRERLHGHNYHVSVKITGSNDVLGEDGYLVDFGDVKRVVRFLCRSMNEYFICPMKSDVMKIKESDDGLQICLTCEDGAFFSFPKNDCVQLPLVHSTAEELAHYFWCHIIRKLGFKNLQARGVTRVEVGIAEAPRQSAIYRRSLPLTEHELAEIETAKLKFMHRPCLDVTDIASEDST